MTPEGLMEVVPPPRSEKTGEQTSPAYKKRSLMFEVLVTMLCGTYIMFRDGSKSKSGLGFGAPRAAGMGEGEGCNLERNMQSRQKHNPYF
jgi:hypothetical protein